MPQQKSRTTHTNDERTVRCPIDQQTDHDCDATPLARGAHLHVMRSSGNGHGDNGEVPPGIDFDDMESAGHRSVSMDYPDERENENVVRVCPYCETPYRGGHGVMIHLGQTAGRKNHPEDAAEIHEPDDFAVVKLDANDNIVDVLEEGPGLPSARKAGALGRHDVEEYIQSLRDQGLDDQADQAENVLLSD